jgi:amiloride-sensitive sodium channel
MVIKRISLIKFKIYLFIQSKFAGIKYLTDKQRHWSEKLFWAIALTISISACSYLIYDSMKKTMSAPLLLSFSPKPINIWEIPFCAITICPVQGNFILQTNNSTNKSSEQDLQNIDNKITNVRWRSAKFKSSRLFSEINTQEGTCYTFNMINFDDLFANNV